MPSREPKSIIRGSSAQRSRSWDARRGVADLSLVPGPTGPGSTTGGPGTGSRVTFDESSTANAQDREHSDGRPTSARKRRPHRRSSISRARGSPTLTLEPTLSLGDASGDAAAGNLDFVGVSPGVGAGDVLELHSSIRHRSTRLLVGYGVGAAGGGRPPDLPTLASSSESSPSRIAGERDGMLSAASSAATGGADVGGGGGESNLERLARSLAALPGSISSEVSVSSTSMYSNLCKECIGRT